MWKNPEYFLMPGTEVMEDLPEEPLPQG